MNQACARPRILFWAALVLAAAGLLCSCHGHTAQGAAQRYAFSGRVVSVDLEDQSAVIDGDAVAGFMDAMAMSYRVKPVEMLKQLSPGDSVSGELVEARGESGNGESNTWLENLKITGHAKAPAPAPHSSK